MKYIAIQTKERVTTKSFDPVYGETGCEVHRDCFIPINEFSTLEKAKAWGNKKCRKDKRIVIITGWILGD